MCYKHPEIQDLCIKVIKPLIRYSTIKLLDKEVKYYNKIQAKCRNCYPTFFAKYHGITQTNLGRGYLYDLITDECGTVSKPLSYYIKNPNILSDTILQSMLDSLKKQMIEYKIFANDMHANNLLCRLRRWYKPELVIVDGLGFAEYIPIIEYSNFFARKKVERKLQSLQEFKSHLKTITK